MHRSGCSFTASAFLIQVVREFTTTPSTPPSKIVGTFVCRVVLPLVIVGSSQDRAHLFLRTTVVVETLRFDMVKLGQTNYILTTQGQHVLDPVLLPQ